MPTQDGNIGYVLAGLIPQRDEQTMGLVPTPGWTGEHEWRGMIPKARVAAPLQSGIGPDRDGQQ